MSVSRNTGPNTNCIASERILAQLHATCLVIPSATLPLAAWNAAFFSVQRAARNCVRCLVLMQVTVVAARHLFGINARIVATHTRSMKF
jgi:hypothetical protein